MWRLILTNKETQLSENNLRCALSYGYVANLICSANSLQRMKKGLQDKQAKEHHQHNRDTVPLENSDHVKWSCLHMLRELPPDSVVLSI